MSDARATMDKILDKLESLDRNAVNLAKKIEKLADRIQPARGEEVRLDRGEPKLFGRPKKPSDLMIVLKSIDDRLWEIEGMARRTESILDTVANDSYLRDDLRFWSQEKPE